VSLASLKSGFEGVKAAGRQGIPAETFKYVGEFAKGVLDLLASECERKAIRWRGDGWKSYEVLVRKGTRQPFSRAVNTALFVGDAKAFAGMWAGLAGALDKGAARKDNIVRNFAGEKIDRAFYTAVIGFAAATDLYNPGNRGAPGALFEIAVGAAIALLTGRAEHSQVVLKAPESDEEVVVKSDEKTVEEPPPGDEPGAQMAADGEEDEEEKEGQAKVKTDRCFPGDPTSLIVALKISTRERISQVSVQQLILDKLRPGAFRSILCACNENNVFGPKGLRKEEKTYDKCWLGDTLVPGTIALYHRHVAPFAGIYYLDPPEPYLSGRYRGFPPVKRFRDLLTADLPMLFGSTSKR